MIIIYAFTTTKSKDGHFIPRDIPPIGKSLPRSSSVMGMPLIKDGLSRFSERVLPKKWTEISHFSRVKIFSLSIAFTCLI